MFGFLVLNKPAGISSRTALDRIERLVRPHKFGHAGTLDPLATGVLVAAIGPATRLIQYVQASPKFYHGQFRLGVESPSEDIESELTPVAGAAEVTESQLARVLPQFIGTIQQMPPAFSALRVNGQRAYRLARKGREVPLQPRPIEIHRLEMTRFEYPDFDLAIECGSGTYVRSLGRDLGRAVGSGAVMTGLQRTAIGPFDLASAIDPEQETQESVQAKLIPAAFALNQLETVVVSADQIAGFRNAVPIDISPAPASDEVASDEVASDEVAAVDSAGRLIAVLRKKPFGLFAPSLNFSHYWAE
jgi:tRNA pseudouridine55 synthase